MQNQSGGGQTGTRDTTYDLTAVLYHALQGVENCKIYAQDAQSGDQRLSQFFQQAAQQQQQLAEQAKQLLHDCLMKETQGGQGGSSGQGSAFSFGQQGSSNIGQQSEIGSTGMGSSSQHEMSGGQSGGTSGSSGY
jgi:hypothetical protein